MNLLAIDLTWESLQMGGRYLVEIDGQEISPSTAPSRLLLDLASAVLAALERIAEHSAKTDLRFVGLEVVDKCAAVAVEASSLSAAEQATVELTDYVSGKAPAPSGLGSVVDAVRSCVVALPPELRSRLLVERRSRTKGFDLVAPPISRREGREIVNLRFEVKRVGGTRPRVRGVDYLTGEVMTLEAPEDLVRALARHLYEFVNLQAQVSRGPTGEFSGGRVLSFKPLAKEPVLQALKAWNESIGRPWRGVDAAVELVRSGSGDKAGSDGA